MSLEFGVVRLGNVAAAAMQESRNEEQVTTSGDRNSRASFLSNVVRTQPTVPQFSTQNKPTTNIYV